MTFDVGGKILDDEICNEYFPPNNAEIKKEIDSLNKQFNHKRNSTPVFAEDASLIHFEEIKITESITATFRHTNTDLIMESLCFRQNPIGLLESF